jgi:CheY-like chemotaxis protein/HPt (histidine-containing phosphotransfer) domain-containing protein
MAPPHHTVPQENPRILLADDNQDNTTLIQLYLEGTPYRLELAANGREAVDRYAAATYDLIFMDLEMPVLDGYEATRAIRVLERQRSDQPHIPILALTAHALPEHRQRCHEAGFTDFLVKPVRRAAILATLARYLGGTSTAAAPEPPQPERERLRPLLPLFFATCDQALDETNRGLALGDLETVRAQGHKLKGSASSFGYWELGLAGEALERAGGDEDAKAALAALTRARDLLDLARQDIDG